MIIRPTTKTKTERRKGADLASMSRATNKASNMPKVMRNRTIRMIRSRHMRNTAFSTKSSPGANDIYV